jgi:putative oxidoreductase
MKAQAWGITVLRLTLGVIFVMHGYLALAVITPARLAGIVTNIGYPAALGPVLGWYLIVAHLVGGFLIIIGLWTRWAALANVPVMASAVLLRHLKQGFFMRVMEGAPGQSIVGGYEFSLLVLAATIALVLLGAGAASVDGARR